ncbi:MAG: carboxylesterase family protein, partial [Candidatus Bathyanammoxibius sp.]
ETLQNRGQPAYNYLFTWNSPLMGGVLGACHAIDVGFLWGTYKGILSALSGTGPAADVLATNVQDAWLTFARTGNPSCESIGKWPTYGDRRETMMLGEKCLVEEAPYDEERRAWDSVPNRVLGVD